MSTEDGIELEALCDIPANQLLDEENVEVKNLLMKRWTSSGNSLQKQENLTQVDRDRKQREKYGRHMSNSNRWRMNE